MTGASGFIAAHVIRQLLEAGYKVRGTVRSQSSADKVKKAHEKYATGLSFAFVEDISVPGAFDEAVKGVDGVCPISAERESLLKVTGDPSCISIHSRFKRFSEGSF